MRITSKGQVTIPRAIRDAAGMLPNTEVDFVLEAGEVKVVKTTAARRATRGSAAVQRLRGRARRSPLSTDEILALTRGET